MPLPRALLLTAFFATATADTNGAVEAPVREPEAPKLDFPELPRSAAWERARWHVEKRLAPGQERIPMDALAPARKAMTALPRSGAPDRYRARHGVSAKAPGAWEPLGPTERGGRTRAIVFDDLDRPIAAGVSGGVWLLEDDGRWRPLGERLVNVNVGTLAIDPTNDDVIYAGTGELYRRTNRPYASMTGSGIFKSTNGGEDWVQLDATVSDDFAYVSAVALSPTDPTRVYAATNTGVWRSDDGGVSFIQTLSTDEGDGPRYEGCTDLTVQTIGGKDRVLATCASRSTDDRYWLPGLLPDACGGPCDARIYLNEDAAGSDAWRSTLSEPGMGRTSLAHFAGDPSIVYALSASTVPGPDRNGDGAGDYDNGLHAVFRSDDGGASWQATLRNTDDDPVSTWMLSFAWQARTDGITPYGAGWYNQAIAVDPEDPDVVWVGGMQLYRSDDGGQRFGLVSNYYGDPDVPGSSGPYMHPDIHSLAFSPDGRFWIGNDGGVWAAFGRQSAADFTNDGYRSLLTGGVVFEPIVSGYTTTQFYHGTVSPDGSIVIGGMQDNGTDALGLPGLPDGWTSVYGGDGAYSAYDPERGYFYVSAQGPTMSRVEDDYQYTYLGEGLQNVAAAPGDFMFITPFTLDPSDTSRLYVGGKRLYRGTGFGDIWAIASAATGTGFRDKANAVAVAPTRPGWVLLGTGNAIYRNNFANFSGPLKVMTSTAPREGWVSSLIFDPNDENIAYATYSSFGGDHVWKSTDGGQSFFPIDGEGDGRLPDVPVHSLAVDPTDPDHLFVGTDLGVFFTADGGERWQVEETGFGGAIVERVVINQPEEAGTSWLYAFTYGRGVWRAPVADVDGQPAFAINPDVNGFWYDAEAPGHGLQVQLIEAEGGLSLLVTWYVYENGQPIWLIGVGPVERDRAIVPMTLTGGASFGDGFDPDAVQRLDWGSLELVFEGPDDLSVRWQSPLGSGRAGTLAMTQLSQPVPLSVPGSEVNLCTTGSYWNPDQNGQGLLVETVLQQGEPALAFSWYHYRNGEQLWLVGSGRFDGNRVVADAFQGSSAEFPPDFDPAAADITRWGELEFTFTGERQFELAWSPDGQPEEAGQLAYTQLTQLADAGCE